jgi:hypothetical protein
MGVNIMNKQENQPLRDTDKLKEIPKWAQRYTQNRTLPLVIFQIFFLACFGMVSLSVYCFLKGKFVLAAIMMGLYVATFIYLLVTSDRHEAHYFTKAGIPQDESVKKVRKFLPIPLMICVAISLILENLGVFSATMRVPFSALYVCPLLIFANWRWGYGSFIGYLWAGLYGAWAIAILFKVPIFTISGAGQLKPGDEMYFVVPVTGLITGLIAYIYSRYSLKKLRGIANLQENTNER